MVKRGHAQSGVDLTSINQTGESDGAAGDKYIGLDFAGRVIDQRWTTSTPTAKDRFYYGYDRDSNRLYKENALSSADSELYAYDNHLDAARHLERHQDRPHGRGHAQPSVGLRRDWQLRQPNNKRDSSVAQSQQAK